MIPYMSGWDVEMPRNGTEVDVDRCLFFSFFDTQRHTEEISKIKKYLRKKYEWTKWFRLAEEFIKIKILQKKSIEI